MSSQEGGKTGSAVGVNEPPLSETASDSKGEAMEKGGGRFGASQREGRGLVQTRRCRRSLELGPAHPKDQEEAETRSELPSPSDFLSCPRSPSASSGRPGGRPRCRPLNSFAAPYLAIPTSPYPATPLRSGQPRDSAALAIPTSAPGAPQEDGINDILEE